MHCVFTLNGETSAVLDPLDSLNAIWLLPSVFGKQANMVVGFGLVDEVESTFADEVGN